MDTRSKILAVLFIAAIAVSIGFTYQRTMINRDFYTIKSDEEEAKMVDVSEAGITVPEGADESQSTESEATTTEAE